MFLRKDSRIIKINAWVLFISMYLNLVGPTITNLQAKGNIEPNNTTNFYSSGNSSKAMVFGPNSIKRNTGSLIRETSRKMASHPFIGGPGQPEMRSFQPANSNDMVDPFTGDFSYNIPLVDVGGYPINIFYQAGVSMEDDASWVGLGWNINPGTITRNVRGIPDDFDGSKSQKDFITTTQNMRPDISASVNAQVSAEIVGNHLPFDFTGGVLWNNKRGIGLHASGEFNFQKELQRTTKTECDAEGKEVTTVTGTTNSVGSISIDLNSMEGLSINASAEIQKRNYTLKSAKGIGIGLDYQSRQGLQAARLQAFKGTLSDSDPGKAIMEKTNIYGGPLTFSSPSFTPTVRIPVNRVSGYLSVKTGLHFYGVLGDIRLSGSYSQTTIKNHIVSKAAFGYLNYQNANDNDNAILDFERLNDNIITPQTPIISVPCYTYDVYVINGQGTGGSFRPYRSTSGFIRDYKTKSTTGDVSLGLDLGTGANVQAGLDIGAVYAETLVDDWQTGNTLRDAVAFKGNYADQNGKFYEAVYFKNPAEKTVLDNSYYQSIGGDEIVRPVLENLMVPLPRLDSKYEVLDNLQSHIDDLDANQIQTRPKEKRTQVISMLNAEEASNVGLQKKIISYIEGDFSPNSCNNFYSIDRYSPNSKSNFRQANHISEIDVLESDGKRYVYGIPAYNITQADVSFSVEKPSDPSAKLVSYDPSTIADNQNGRDWYYEKTKTPAYAHSFLLSGILSPDYQDLTGDGITDDDIGTAIKFNYSKVNENTSGNHEFDEVNWRMPKQENMALYNPNLKTDSKDDMASYSYGTKELWYLHSVESKNMIATFFIKKRKDGFGVAGENGGSSNTGERRLERIDLFTKAEYLKDPNHRKPIKSVYFDYDYSLCPNSPSNNGASGTDNVNKGKLTLKSIWCTYRGSTLRRNIYRFTYAKNKQVLVNGNMNTIDCNPSYAEGNLDRWGGYKNPAYNPNQVSNADFPYNQQKEFTNNGNQTDYKALNDAYASVYNLEEISIPGGSKITVDYESDDYAFVQNKRARTMKKIVGFAKHDGDAPTDNLYKFNIVETAPAMDYRLVCFDAGFNVTDENLKLFFNKEEKDEQLLLRLWVDMPNDYYGGGYEPIDVLSYYDRVFKDPDYNAHPTWIWVELRETKKGGSPVIETVFQYMKDHLPSKAFPGSDMGDSDVLKQIVSAVLAQQNNISAAMQGFEYNTKSREWARKFDRQISSIRVNDPDFQKFGGGHRVRKITITDNWERMSSRDNINNLSQNEQQKTSTYGTEYFYTTEENGVDHPISSGVATYEPGIGSEENPFKGVTRYSHKQFLGPRTIYNTLTPVLEKFYPSPSIGYAKVTSKSINRNTSTKKIKSGVGTNVTEFYTCRDFPIYTNNTNFDSKRSRRHIKSTPGMSILFHYSAYLIAFTQGFRIVLNDMHGKVKETRSYSENNTNDAISKTHYYYKTTNGPDGISVPDSRVELIQNPQGQMGYGMIGKNVEIMNDFRQHTSWSGTIQLPANLDNFFVGSIPVILLNIISATATSVSKYRSATTLKVVTNYGILEKVVVEDRGSSVTTENLAYDAQTGEPLLTKVENSFKQPVYNLTYPAHWINSGMDLAYKNINVTMDHVDFVNGRLLNVTNMDKYFESGDEIYVFTSSKNVAVNSACNTSGYGTAGFGIPTNDPPRLIWALDIRKDDRNAALTNRFIFIDRKGKPFSGHDVNLKIIRSGKRNMFAFPAETVTLLKDPRVNGYLLVNQNSSVLNASALEYREKWKAEDAYYSELVGSMYDHWVPLHSGILSVAQTRAVSKFTDAVNFTSDRLYLESTTNTILARKATAAVKIPKMKCYLFVGCFPILEWRNIQLEHKSFVKLDFGNIPSNAQIKEAKLNIWAHTSGSGNPHYFKFKNFNGNVWTDPKRHTSNFPHEVSPTIAPGNFRISKISGNFPGNESQFFSAFDNLNENHSMLIPIPGISFLNPFSQGSYSGSNSIDVSSLLRDIQLDRMNGINSGLKFDIPGSPGNLPHMDVRACFEGYNNNPAPHIKVDWFVCSEALAYGSPEPTGPHTICSYYEVLPQCISTFSKPYINPYVMGLLGNWRPWKNYIFYGDRKEKAVTSPLVGATSIDKDGTLDAYQDFWVYNSSTGFRQKTTSTKWVANSESSQFNRKGAEIENFDALNRYTSAVFGYDESLPIAVGNNVRVREIAFDGFEDYDYHDQSCDPACKTPTRHFDLNEVSDLITESTAHTGNSSLMINTGSSKSFSFPTADIDQINVPDLKVGLQNNSFNYNAVGLTGSGLTLRSYPNANFTGTYTTLSNSANVYYSGGWNNCTAANLEWEGYLVTTHTGNYIFDLNGLTNYVRGEAWLEIQSVEVARSSFVSQTDTHSSKFLEAGIPYQIRMRWTHVYSDCPGAMIRLNWKEDLPNSTLSTISLNNLYPAGNPPAHQSLIADCSIPNEIKVLDHKFIDHFSLIPGRKYVMSIWVRDGINLNPGMNYNNRIDLKFNGVSAGVQPIKGKMIEGWQQHSYTFTVPTNATTFEIVCSAGNAYPSFFDDIRIHPFDANLKSFVYDPINLRLMAELDENNYASYYEYDDEGTLTRVKKETERGIKTITETRSSIQTTVY